MALRSLYVCYLSLDDPLVDSQVVAYLEGLARAGHEIHLLTFETGPLSRVRRRRLRQAMSTRGLHWHGLRYHKRPSLPATIYDATVGALFVVALVVRHDLDTLHARAHVPAAMALIARRLLWRRRPALIFDIRGLMAEEYADAGRWRRDGVPFRLTKAVERAASTGADGIVVLTHRVRFALFGELPRDDVFVIPCCADVERIVAARRHREMARQTLGIGEKRVLVFVGKLGGWYREAELADFFETLRRVVPDLHLLVVTQNDGAEVERQFARNGITSADCTITSVEQKRIGELLAVGDAAIALARPGPSTVGSSPTKIGECLAAGLPIVATDIGDVKELLEGSRTGFVLERLLTDDYQQAAGELAAMIADPDIAARCIATARERLSLRTVGVPRYEALYRFVAERAAPSQAPSHPTASRASPSQSA